jgi:hypothetical protein
LKRRWREKRKRLLSVDGGLKWRIFGGKRWT